MTALETLRSLVYQATAHRIRARVEFGLDPYGIALHPGDVQALKASIPMQPNDTLLPPSFCGLKLFQDPEIPRGTAEILSESEAILRYRPTTEET